MHAALRGSARGLFLHTAFLRGLAVEEGPGFRCFVRRADVPAGPAEHGAVFPGQGEGRDAEENEKDCHRNCMAMFHGVTSGPLTVRVSIQQTVDSSQNTDMRR